VNLGIIYFVRTFINVTMCPHNNSMIIKNISKNITILCIVTPKKEGQIDKLHVSVHFFNLLERLLLPSKL
jgi:hypothetical protein